MKYLGFPISDKRLGCGTFRDITCKMRKKLQPWKGKNLTSGGSLILTNSSLSSMPIYMMSIFHLYGEIHRRMDTIRSKFFWGSDGDKFRYHMVRWEHTCLPRDFGGAGILNTRLLNEALLLKWAWRIYSHKEEDICCKLLENKYLSKNLLQDVETKGVAVLARGEQNKTQAKKGADIQGKQRGEGALLGGSLDR
jgi:hypothetical protein